MSNQQVVIPNHVAMTLPSRPSLGDAGRKTKVETNHYELKPIIYLTLPKQKPSGPFHHYDCKIIDKEPRTDGKPSKPIPSSKNMLIMQQYAEMVLKHKVRFAYDSKANLYTYEMLPEDSLSAEVTLNLPGRHSSVYKIILHYVAKIPSEPFYKYLAGKRPESETDANDVTSYIRVIDIMLHQWPALRFIPGGKNFFCPDDAQLMAAGLMILKGAFQSARMAGVGMNGMPTNKLLVNIDTAAATFRQPLNLVEAMGRFFGMNPDHFTRYPGPDKKDTDAFNKEYRGVEIECTHVEHRPHYKIDRFTYVTADKVKFMDDQTKKETTVVAYFKKQYNLSLKFGACLPCVIVKKKKDIYIPVEVCVIRYNNKLSPFVQAEFIQYACVPPNERVRKIQELTRRIDFNNNPDLKAFDMAVNTKQMLILDARILKEPVLAYSSTSKQSKLTPKAGWGSWNLEGQKVISGAKLSSWAIAAFGSENEMPTSVIDKFVKQLINVCQIQEV
ncbi:PAZ domain-containing protein [Endogone sp. FLAS-F59071]|nr:PAZ domain-containing protein [Endogone sp. FLAS-F59071]|eukprot:RUS23363.1 PAZ domain-containing protein [Endogone sp. FLAS-F59071]